MIQLLVYDHLNFPVLSAKWLGPLTGNKQQFICEQSLLLPYWARRSKGSFAWITSNLWNCRSPNFWTSKSCLRVKLVSKCEHQCIDNDKLMVIIELVVACAWLLGLGSKLYLSNMQRVFSKDLAWFMQSLSCVHQNLANVCCCQVANYIVHFYSSRFINKTAKSSQQGQSLKSW